MTDSPTHVCSECGLAANTLTCLVQYGRLPHKPAFELSTFNEGKCECCDRLTAVTETRDFFHPDFSLVSPAFRKALRSRDRRPENGEVPRA